MMFHENCNIPVEFIVSECLMYTMYIIICCSSALTWVSNFFVNLIRALVPSIQDSFSWVWKLFSASLLQYFKNKLVLYTSLIYISLEVSTLREDKTIRANSKAHLIAIHLQYALLVEFPPVFKFNEVPNAYGTYICGYHKTLDQGSCKYCGCNSQIQSTFIGKIA